MFPVLGLHSGYFRFPLVFSVFIFIEYVHLLKYSSKFQALSSLCIMVYGYDKYFISSKFKRMSMYITKDTYVYVSKVFTLLYYDKKNIHNTNK